MGLSNALDSFELDDILITVNFRCSTLHPIDDNSIKFGYSLVNCAKYCSVSLYFKYFFRGSYDDDDDNKLLIILIVFCEKQFFLAKNSEQIFTYFKTCSQSSQVHFLSVSLFTLPHFV